MSELINKLKAIATFGAGGTFQSKEDSAELVALGYVEINENVSDEYNDIATRITELGVQYLASIVEQEKTETVADAVEVAPWTANAPVAEPEAETVAEVEQPAPVEPVAEPAPVEEKPKRKPRATKAVVAETADEKPTEVSEPEVFAIETDVPLPAPKQSRAGAPSRFPFGTLEVGQSFFVAGKTAKALASTVASASKRFAVNDPSGATKLNRKGVEVPKQIFERHFIVRDEVKDKVAGCRVWRDL